MARAIDSGSLGIDGPLDVATHTRLPARANGIYHYTSIRVRSGARLTFEANANNSPIHLLATESVIIEGIVDVSGIGGGAINGGAAGPGGFPGGKPGIAGKAPGAGYGPGGGKPGVADGSTNSAGGGAYATQATIGISANKGAVYGSDLLVPLLGGSGGGGQPNQGGGGGGGAILIASSKSITIATTGRVEANGGVAGPDWGYGSGGAIRLVADRVAGTGQLSVRGQGFGGDGRIRVDTLNRDGLALQFQPGSPGTLVVGSLMVVFPPVTPQIEILSVGSETIRAGGSASVFVHLPPGTSPNQSIALETRDFNQLLPVTLAIIPDSGAPAFYNVTVDNLNRNPSGKVSVPVTIPPNTLVRIMAWSR